MGKIGSICHFSRALPASIWGHCSQVLVSTSIWDTQKGVWRRHLSCCFSQHLGIWDPQTLQNKGKNKMTNRPCFYPPTCPISPYSKAFKRFRTHFWCPFPLLRKTSGFRHSAPSIKGVNLHPLTKGVWVARRIHEPHAEQEIAPAYALVHFRPGFFVAKYIWKLH